MVGIAMFTYIYANIPNNTYADVYANGMDYKGRVAFGCPPFAVNRIGMYMFVHARLDQV